MWQVMEQELGPRVMARATLLYGPLALEVADKPTAVVIAGQKSRNIAADAFHGGAFEHITPKMSWGLYWRFVEKRHGYRMWCL